MPVEGVSDVIQVAVGEDRAPPDSHGPTSAPLLDVNGHSGMCLILAGTGGRLDNM